MRRMPILVRLAPFLPGGCPPGIYAGLARLSAGCPPDRGRLHTCYSPVRRSPAAKASFRPAAPRLACVKPAASVHPEPGSNSPLLVYSFLFLLLCRPDIAVRPVCLGPQVALGCLVRLSIDGDFVCVPCLLVSVCMARTMSPSVRSCPVALLSMFSRSRSLKRRRLVSRLRLQNYNSFSRSASFLCLKTYFFSFNPHITLSNSQINKR